MKKFFLSGCLVFLMGLSNAFADGNQGYIQGAQPAVSPSTQGRVSSDAFFNVAQIGFQNTPLNKLGRGLTNVATFYLELPATAEREAKAKNSEIYGATVGILGGVFMSLLRGFTGIWDTLTFIFPPYNKPMMQPTYAYDSFMEADRRGSITQ